MKKEISSILTVHAASIVIRLLFIIAVINLINYGKVGINWPANISGFSGFEDKDQNDIISAINDLNTRNYRPFLSFNNEYSENQKIYFKMMKNDLVKEQDSNTIVAQAYVELNKCTIEVFPSALYGDILKIVIWHELGHCSGLNHSDNPNDIMYWLVASTSTYNQSSIDRFVFNLTKSLK